jgi:phosphatidylinositol phospholipase C delta
MKPLKGWLSHRTSIDTLTGPAPLTPLNTELDTPKHVLINLSESACNALLPHCLPQLITHAQKHLRRIFPRGTRIASSNVDVLRFWRNGSQVVSLNWQSYDRGMQINEAMFVGSGGWILKPPVLVGGQSTERKMKLNVEVVGISGCGCCFSLFYCLFY